MKPSRYFLFLIASALIFSGCSGNLPLFQELHLGRSDLLERIEVTPGNVTLTDITYTLFSATGYYNDGSTADLTAKCEWSIDDQSVAVITSGGYLQARALSGNAKVTARFDSLTSSADVSINIRLVSISITPSETTLRSSNQVYLTAKGTASDGTVTDLTRSVTWNVSPFTLGSVDETGLFAASGTNGTVTITATSPDGTITSGKATVTLDLTTIYADASFTAQPGDGTKEKPFPTLSRAISQAKAIGATRINAAKGTYSEDLVIDADISLFGGYNPVYTGAEWTRDAAVVPSDTRIVAKGSTAILYQNGLAAGTVLDSFLVERGESALSNAGAAVMCSNASPSLQNCEIYGTPKEGVSSGTELPTTSAALMCINASPTIRNNLICGGSSQVMSYGIMLQTSSAKIANNTISGGLPGYIGGGSDNIAILAQSASNPTIDANTITGPSGGESTYRIKCESSSNAMITNNAIETTSASVASARGILAISSSPMIQGNTISAAASSAIAIRGENTSFSVTENSIGGSIYITSGSMNPSVSANTKISGNITVNGASTGVVIRNHMITDPADPEYKNHYKKSITKVIEGGIYYTGSATGTIINNSMSYFEAKDNANFNFTENIIIQTALSTGAWCDGAYGRFTRNMILVSQQNETSAIVGINVTNTNAAVIICNNIIHAYNSSTTTPKDTRGISLTYCYLVRAYNNLIAPTSNSNTGPALGIFMVRYTESNIMGNYNNIILTTGPGYKSAIHNMCDYRPAAMCSNYISGADVVFYDSSASPYTYNTVSDFEQLRPSYYLGNAISLPDEMKWKDFDSSRIGEDFADNDFTLLAESILIQKGKDPDDFIAIGAYASSLISPDFSGTPRTLTTGQFSVGPYEYVAP